MKRRLKFRALSPLPAFELAQLEVIPEERICRDGSCIVAPLTGSRPGVARLPARCIKCGTTHDLEFWSEMSMSQNRPLGQEGLFVKSYFWICRWHSRIARAWRWGGVLMLLGSISLFIAKMFGSMERSSKTQNAIWAFAFCILLVSGLMVGGPWRGPLRLVNTHRGYAWFTGTGRAFRSGFKPWPGKMEMGKD